MAKSIIDGHFDLLMEVVERRKNGEKQVIKRLFEKDLMSGGVTGIIASVFVDSKWLPFGATQIAIEQISALHCEIEEYPERLMLCLTGEDFEIANKEGKIGFLLSLEGAEPISSCLSLHAFYKMGVRGLGLAWSRRNMAADGCDFRGSSPKGGLTDFGKALVLEAERLNMIIDVSHLSDEGVDDVLSLTHRPIIASHSNARDVFESKRNLSSKHMKEIAKRGGVAGLNNCSVIVGAEKSYTENIDQRFILKEHLDYMVSIMGDENVAFGFDFCDQFLGKCSKEDMCRYKDYPYDLIKGHKEIPSFLLYLKNNGYTDEMLDKLSGDNWIRLFKSVFLK